MTAQPEPPPETAPRASRLVSVLDDLPRVPLGHWPTPLEPLPRLRDALGGGPRLWCKREDASGLALGGNKVRKLERHLGVARARGAGAVVTFGAVQSNHCRQTAAAAVRCGLEAHLVLSPLVPRHDPVYLAGGNRLLDDLLGAHVHPVDDPDAAAERADSVVAELAARGLTAHVVPPGGSDAVGTIGWVDGGLELLGQCADAGIGPSALVVAASTGGTAAGLRLAADLGGHEELVVEAVDVAGRAETTAATIAELRRRALDHLAARAGGDDTDPGTGPVITTDAHRGPAYGAVTDDMVEAVRLLARTEGIVCDPVYSGKALAGLVDGVRRARWNENDDIVFVHTGGTPALFAYGDIDWTDGS
ncbi:MAG: D-cysteine desulfhydrase family protein [Actinomyces sp.]|nr:MAG: D-cysteine desulfhydrase family protein [Actinomyces sp.]